MQFYSKRLRVPSPLAVSPKQGILTAEITIMLLALGLASESFTDQTTSVAQLQPSAPLLSCDLNVKDKDELMRCWAHRMAKEMPAQYLCNVSKLPEKGPAELHPALQGSNLNNFLLPPDTHLFLYGPSHVRSVFHVLVSAAELLGKPVQTEYISVSDDCDEEPGGLTGQAMKDSPEATAVCGIFQDDDTCKTGDLVRVVFPGDFPAGGSSITLVANHRQYLVPDHTNHLNTLLESADPPFTHAYFSPPHLTEYFDAHCDFRKGGPPPDPSKIGDGSEAFCDITKPTCMGTSPLFAAIRSHIPNAAFLGGVALKHNFDVDSSCSRIHDAYSGDIAEEGPVHRDPEGRPVHVHACNAVCNIAHTPSGTDPYVNAHCKAGEGVAIAWEVLRSVGLLSCPKEWKSCDPLKFQPLWVLGANRNQSPNGANKNVLTNSDSDADCPKGERNADKDECTAATIEAVGQGQVTGKIDVINKPDTTKVPAGCSYNRAEKRPVFNHAGDDGGPVPKAIPGYPLVCTFSVQRPVGMTTNGGLRNDGMVYAERLPSRPYQKGAAAAEIAAEIAAGWRRNVTRAESRSRKP